RRAGTLRLSDADLFARPLQRRGRADGCQTATTRSSSARRCSSRVLLGPTPGADAWLATIGYRFSVASAEAYRPALLGRPGVSVPASLAQQGHDHLSVRAGEASDNLWLAILGRAGTYKTIVKSRNREASRYNILQPMHDLSVPLGGLHLQNPILVASGT